MYIKFFGIFLTIFLFVSSLTVHAQSFPKPSGYVNDFAKLYSPAFVNDLEQDLSEFEASTSAEISVVTVENLQDTTIDEYSVKLFEEWKIGKEKSDNGVLLVIARDEREVRIEVGYGLEGVITDARAGRIIRDEIVPEFKKEDFEAGTSQAVSTLMSYIRGESVPEPAAPSRDWSWLSDIIPFLFFGVVYIGSFLARSKDYYAGGIIGAVIGAVIGVFVGQLVAIFFLLIVLGLIGLLLDYVLSRNYQYLKSHNKSTDWWHSRGGFSSGSSSGGFGGFGGGMSGGGGASGKW